MDSGGDTGTARGTARADTGTGNDEEMGARAEDEILDAPLEPRSNGE